VVLDLKSDEGKAIAFDIIRQSDVIANNFGPGAMDRMGLGYDAVRAVKPDIIYLSMPMYGEDGPRAELLGVGMTISAVTGLMWSTGYRANDPVGPGTHYPDHAANPYHAAFAVLAGLRRRRLTGLGLKIDLSQVESTVNFVGTAAVAAALDGADRPQTGNGSETMAPHGIYACAGADDWCAVAVATDAQWQALARLIGVDDPPLATAAARLAARDRIDRALADWLEQQPVDSAAETLRAAGVPAARVAHSRHLVEDDPQLAAREYWQRVDHPELGRSLYASPPYLIDGARVDLTRPPLLGEHTRQVLSGLLGRTDAEFDRLDSKGIFQ
ncbi:MAG: CoA transferase, partial [Gemmobacter sp.]|nr:CoA transferase [Gemmobacter sp.]